MKTKTAFLIIFLISLILSLSFSVFSITEAFVAMAENATISSCSCAIAENTIKIGNTGNINSLYSITQKGDAARWSVISPKSFSLEEKKTKILLNPINIPCDAKTGQYELLTYIETGFGMKKVITQTVSVEKCEAENKETINSTIETKEDINQTGNNTTETPEITAKKNGSVILKVLKWVSYAVAAFIILGIIMIIILYRSESHEESVLEEDIKSVKREAAKRKTSKSSKKKARRNR